jgi:hypothetical protein
MDKSVWKFFTKGTVATAAKVFIGFTLATSTWRGWGGRSSDFK